MTDSSQFSASSNLLGRLAGLNVSPSYVLLPPLEGAEPLSPVLLTDDKPALLAALGARSLLAVPANEAYSFTLPTQAGHPFQVYGLGDGFLPAQWVRALLDQRVSRVDERGLAIFGVPSHQTEMIGVYRQLLHSRNQALLVAAETWQGLACQLSGLGASPCAPLDPALAFQPRAADVLHRIAHGFGSACTPSVRGLIQDALRGKQAPGLSPARVLWVAASPQEAQEVARQVPLTNTRYAVVNEATWPVDAPVTTDGVQDGLPPSHWDDGPKQGFDAVVVQDLVGWSLQHVKGAVLTQTLESMLAGRAQWGPLLQEGARLLWAQLKPGGRLVVSQSALQENKALNWGYNPFKKALEDVGGTCVAAWGAWPNAGTWFPWSLLSDGLQANAILNVGLAADGPFPPQPLTWQGALDQGQGLALARAWCWVIDKLEPADSTGLSALPFDGARVVQQRNGKGQIVEPDSQLLAAQAQTVQLAFFEAATLEGWSMSALSAVYERYLQAVQTLVPELPLRKWLAGDELAASATLLSTDMVKRLCEAMPDQVGWHREGAVFQCSPCGGQPGESLLDAVARGEHALSAPRWLLASLVVLLRGVPQWGRHGHQRGFTRVQWAENLMALVGIPCLAGDWQSAGIPPEDWGAEQNLPVPAPSAELAARDARIATLEHQLHYEQTDKNVALEQLAAASEVARGVTADVRRVVTQEVAADVRRRVSAEYEASLSWRVSKPLRKAKSLLGRLRARGAAPPSIPVDAPATEVAPAPMLVPVGHPGAHVWAQAEPSGELTADYLPRFDYGRWVTTFDHYDAFAQQAMRQKWGESKCAMVLGFVILPATSMAQLAQLMGDLLGQVMPDWHAVILVSPDVPLDEACTQTINSDVRLQCVTLAEAAAMAEAIRAGMRALPTEVRWASALQANARLNCVALSALAQACQAHPEWQMVYSDVDTLNEKARRCQPYFKPDWNEALFFSSALAPSLQDSLVSGTLWVEPKAWQNLALPALALDASAWALTKLAMVLQIDPQQARGAIGHVSVVMSHHPAADLNAAAREQGLAMLRTYFEQQGESVELALTPHGVQVRWPLPTTQALVSLIIPTRNNPKLLSQCVNSILETTQEVEFEVIVVDNGSDTPQALDTLRKLAEHPKVRVVRDSSPFNYSALNNHAVSLARGQWVALVNDDIEVLPGQGQWLAEMLRQAARPQVGVVGAKLLYPDGSVQHAGVFLVGTLSWHAYRHFPADHPGHGRQAQLTRQSTCLTAACIVVRKSIYEQVGGLDATHLTVGWNDTDFCLKVMAAGYFNVWTPDAVLVHHESATRGQDQTPEKKARAEREWRTMQQRWGEKMSVDPCYNPNLSCGYEDYSWAWPPRPLIATPGDTP